MARNAHAVVVPEIIESAMDVGATASTGNSQAIAEERSQNDGIGPRFIWRSQDCLRRARDKRSGLNRIADELQPMVIQVLRRRVIGDVRYAVRSIESNIRKELIAWAIIEHSYRRPDRGKALRIEVSAGENNIGIGAAGPGGNLSSADWS